MLLINFKNYIFKDLNVAVMYDVKKKFLSLVGVSVFIFFGCTTSSYKLIGESEYANDDFKYILLREQYTSRATSILRMINASDWEGLDTEIRLTADLDLKYFLKAVRFLKNGQSIEAYNLLRRIDESNFDCQVKILKVDCLSNLHVDSVDIRKKYQEAFDCTADPLIKNIAKTHYRFHQYGR